MPQLPCPPTQAKSGNAHKVLREFEAWMAGVGIQYSREAIKLTGATAGQLGVQVRDGP